MTTGLRIRYGNPRLMRTMFLHLQEQQASGLFCDVILQGNGDGITVHACLLAACSPYMANFLSSFDKSTDDDPDHTKQVECRRHVINMPGFSSHCLLSLAHYLYTSELEVSPADADEVLEAARVLRIPELELLKLERGRLVRSDSVKKLNRKCLQKKLTNPHVEADSSWGKPGMAVLQIREAVAYPIQDEQSRVAVPELQHSKQEPAPVQFRGTKVQKVYEQSHDRLTTTVAAKQPKDENDGAVLDLQSQDQQDRKALTELSQDQQIKTLLNKDKPSVEALAHLGQNLKNELVVADISQDKQDKAAMVEFSPEKQEEAAVVFIQEKQEVVAEFSQEKQDGLAVAELNQIEGKVIKLSQAKHGKAAVFRLKRKGTVMAEQTQEKHGRLTVEKLSCADESRGVEEDNDMSAKSCSEGIDMYGRASKGTPAMHERASERTDIYLRAGEGGANMQKQAVKLNIVTQETAPETNINRIVHYRDIKPLVCGNMQASDENLSMLKRVANCSLPEQSAAVTASADWQGRSEDDENGNQLRRMSSMKASCDNHKNPPDHLKELDSPKYSCLLLQRGQHSTSDKKVSDLFPQDTQEFDYNKPQIKCDTKIASFSRHHRWYKLPPLETHKENKSNTVDLGMSFKIPQGQETNQSSKMTDQKQYCPNKNNSDCLKLRSYHHDSTKSQHLITLDHNDVESQIEQELLSEKHNVVHSEQLECIPASLSEDIADSLCADSTRLTTSTEQVNDGLAVVGREAASTEESWRGPTRNLLEETEDENGLTILAFDGTNKAIVKPYSHVEKMHQGSKRCCDLVDENCMKKMKSSEVQWAPRCEAESSELQWVPSLEAGSNTVASAPSWEVETNAVTSASSWEAETNKVANAPSWEAESSELQWVPSLEAGSNTVASAPSWEAETNAVTSAPSWEAETNKVASAPGLAAESSMVANVPICEAESSTMASVPVCEAEALSELEELFCFFQNVSCLDSPELDVGDDNFVGVSPVDIWPDMSSGSDTEVDVFS